MENIVTLTVLEEKMLMVIRGHFAQHGHAPTLSEIGLQLDINSKGTIHRYVQSLIDKGYLCQTERGWRGIRLANQDPRTLTTLPLAGRIAAGQPIEAIPDLDRINLADLIQEDHYALEVKGDSMIDIGILDGDTVIIKSQSTAKQGEVVVALIDEHEATLKRIHYHTDSNESGVDSKKISLIPENISMNPLTYAAERVTIQGILVSQLRFY